MKLKQIIEAEVDTSTGEVHRWRDRHKLLEKYANDPSVFVHFSDVNKLGINPKSSFNTPIGIYAYPVNYVLSPDEGTGTPFMVPFGYDRKFSHIFRVRDLRKCLIVDDDTVSDMVNDFYDCKLEDHVKLFSDDGRGTTSEIWLWPHMLQKMEYAAFKHCRSEELFKIIYDTILMGERSSYEAWHIEKTPQLTRIPSETSLSTEISGDFPKFPAEDQISEIVGYDSLDRIKAATIFRSQSKAPADNALSTLSYEDPVANDVDLLWRFTRTVGDYLSLKTRSRKAPVAWSKVLMNLGISGVIDNGFGVIHPNEPTQAVFFKIDDLIHLDVIKNQAPIYTNEDYMHLSDVADSAKRGDFGYIDIFINRRQRPDTHESDVSEFTLWLERGFRLGQMMKSPDESFAIFASLDHIQSFVNTKAKFLLIYKSNGGAEYRKIRPIIVENINEGIKFARSYISKLVEASKSEIEYDEYSDLPITKPIDERKRFGKFYEALDKLARSA